LKEYQNAGQNRINEERKLDIAKTKGKISKDLERLESHLRMAMQEEAHYAKKHEFALLCIYQELQFFHHYKSNISTIFQELVQTRTEYLSQVSNVLRS
jgi:hypothetical protein